jgi:penicillin-binding protein-related factor A (putative recombinase)
MSNINYLLTGEDYINYIDNNSRKSISYSYIQEKAHLIKESYQPQLDYLKAVDEIYFKGE